jgi:cystinosin
MKNTVTGYKTQQNFSSSNIAIASKIHDIKLLVNETIMLNFDISNEKSLKQSTKIAFNTTKIGIISIDSSNILITKNLTQFSILFTSQEVGKSTVSLVENSTLKQLDLKNAYIQFTVQHSNILDLLSQIIGWIYFLSWSLSFYQQVVKNWKRKSVVGLDFDFVALNILGFGLYSFFNVALYWVKPIQSTYFSRHPQGYI